MKDPLLVIEELVGGVVCGHLGEDVNAHELVHLLDPLHCSTKTRATRLNRGLSHTVYTNIYDSS